MEIMNWLFYVRHKMNCMLCLTVIMTHDYYMADRNWHEALQVILSKIIVKIIKSSNIQSKSSKNEKKHSEQNIAAVREFYIAIGYKNWTSQRNLTTDLQLHSYNIQLTQQLLPLNSVCENQGLLNTEIWRFHERIIEN